MPITKPARRTLIAGAVGNAIEFYDFVIYAFLAQYFAVHFFPTHDPVTGLIATYGGFAAGMLMRPIGAILIGAIGDRVGRATALQLSVIMISVPTLLIGLLPTYESIGLWAPALLLAMRLIQGLSLGGEYPAAVVFLIERSAPADRGWSGSFSPLGVVLGLLLGSVVCLAITLALGESQMRDWGWRVPFIASVVLTVIGVALRQAITPDRQSTEGHSRPGLFNTLSTYWPQIIAMGLANAVAGVTGFIGLMYAVPWMIREAGITASMAYGMNFVSLILCAWATLLGGWLGDRIGRYRTVVLGASLALVGAWPAFLCLHSGWWPIMPIGSLLIALSQGLFTGPFCACMAALLPREVRVTALAIGFSTSMGLFGGLSPMLAEYLVGKQQWGMAPAWMMMAAATLSLAALLSMPVWRRFNEALPEDSVAQPARVVIT